MKIPKPYFTNVPHVGDLEFYYAFYMLERPILFICKDANNNVYLCSCCELYPELQWVIAKISIQEILSLIDNKLSLFDIFQSSENKWVAEWKEGDLTERIYEVNLFDDDMLPDKGEFLDAEDGEFNDVASVLLAENIDTNDIQYDQDDGVGASEYFSEGVYVCNFNWSSEINQKTISLADNFSSAA